MGYLKPNTEKYSNIRIIKTTAVIPAKFCEMINIPNFPSQMILKCTVMDNAVGCYAYGNMFWLSLIHISEPTRPY